ncbi:hypothetical protein EKK58_09820 [Candidatus Dependentiae bacterium]|nr:MAG: hypothetical protein EKK58_09820 [Candidatus Dependentiae bacterium]
MANVLQQAVQATTLNYTDKDRLPNKYQPQVGIKPNQIEANAPVSELSQFARKLTGGVVSGANELVTATMTGVAAATDNELLRNSAEMTRNEIQAGIDTYTRQETQESGWMDTLSYGLGKYLGVPGLGAASGIGRLGVAATGAVLASSTGAISYQETKQELMKEDIDRDTANTAGIITGVGMGLSTVIPVAPSLTSAVRATTKLGLGVAGGAVAGVGISQGSFYGAGSYVSDKGLRIQDPDLANKYKKAGEQYKDMATDPVAWGIGLGMGVLIGGAVGYSKYKQFKRTEALINQYKSNPIATQADIDAYKQKHNIKDAAAYTPDDIDIERKSRKDPNWIPKQEDIDFEVALEVDFYRRIEQAKAYTYQDIASSGVLTTSDQNIILNNNRLINEFNKTGDASLLDQLEIPQVHRDAYLLRYESISGYRRSLDPFNQLNDKLIRERYFDIEGIRDAYNNGKHYIPPHTTNVTTKVKSTPAVKYKDNLADTIGKGEGSWYSFNRGKSGDSPNEKLNENITIQEIRNRQALPQGDKRRLFAVGKYQIIPSTLEEAVVKLRLDPNTKFTPEVQEYIFRQYLMKIKSPSVYKYITGASDNLEGAQLRLAQEFASIGIPRDIAGKTKGQSYYAGVGNNKASISPDTVARQLDAQRKRYQEGIKKGMSEDEAWDYSFGDSTIQARLSDTVKGDIKSTRSTNKDGGIFKEGEVVGTGGSGERLVGSLPRTEFVIPDKQPFSIVGYIKDLFGANNILIDTPNGKKWVNNRSNNTYNGELGRLVGKDLDMISMQSRAIQKVYEELSYQYALNIRDKALKMTPSLTKTEVQTIMRNAYDNHQANLKIGQSKIFNEEYVNAKGRGEDNDTALSSALTATNLRLQAAAIGQSTRTGFSQSQSKQDDSNTVVQDITNTTGSVKDQTINGKKVVDEQDVTNNKPGRDPKDDDANAKDGNATKDGNDKDGNTKEGNTKDGNDKDGNDKDGNAATPKDDGTKTSKLTLDDGSTLTRISTKLPDGRVRNVYIDAQGNRTLHAQPTKADPNAVANLVNSGLKDTDTVTINGQVLSKAEIQQLLALNGKIDDNALQQFAACALNFGNP